MNLCLPTIFCTLSRVIEIKFCLPLTAITFAIEFGFRDDGMKREAGVNPVLYP